MTRCYRLISCVFLSNRTGSEHPSPCSTMLFPDFTKFRENDANPGHQGGNANLQRKI